MRVAALSLLIPTLCFSRIPPLENYLDELGRNSHFDDSEEEVIQPPRPKNRHHSYDIRLFRWTTNMTNFFEWNDFNTTIPRNDVDVGIICRSERAKVVVRLVPLQYADACNYEGGVVAHCPDYNVMPPIYANTRDPGDYVLTTFSDGTKEGLHSTSGGYCLQGLKFPLKIIDSARDHERFILEVPSKFTPKSANAAHLSIAFLLFLIVQ